MSDAIRDGRGPGRPAKDGVNLHTQVPQETKDKIDQLATLFDCSQGDVIAQAVKALLASFKISGTLK